MVSAIIFPGQGSQILGMGYALQSQYPSARQVFEEVDEALGDKLSDVIWNGPSEKLTLTANAQPALMAVSIATMRAMQAEGFDLYTHASFVAGHSLGEYSALCAAGSISLSDTARLLRVRGNAMQEAVSAGEGAMAAIIGLEYDEVEHICCKTISSVSNKLPVCCQIANDNGAGQIVISGTKSEIASACKLADKLGAKRVLLLPVSAPFHCELMFPAADIMRKALEKVDIKAPIVPLVSNVTANFVNSPEEIHKCLVKQVTGRVRWKESVMRIIDNKVTTFIEVGSGRVLTGLVKRISKNLKCISVSNPDELAKAKSVWNNFCNKK